MRWLLTILMLFCLGAEGQVYNFTIDTNTCRIDATGGGLISYQFQVDRIRYVDRHQNILVFDDRTTLALSDGMLGNYPTVDSLKGQLDLWFLDCQGGGVTPTPPAGKTALFANTRSVILDGSTEYITVADADNLSFGDGVSDSPVTWTGWVKSPDLTATSPLMTKIAASGNADWAVDIAGSNIRVLLYDGTDAKIRGRKATIASLNNDEWFSYAITYDGRGGSLAYEGIAIYMNGVQISTGNLTGATYTAMHSGTSDLKLGYYEAYNLYTDGEFDNFAIWDTVLSLQMIKELSAIRDYNYHSQIDNIISWWSFDSPDSIQAGGVNDLKGTNDGSTVNMTVADNFTPCVTFPYDYQLDSNASYTNLTPMQSTADTSFGGFGFSLDGINERVSIADNALLSRGNGTTDQEVSFTAWVNANDYTSMGIFTKELEYNFFTDPTDKLSIRFYDETSGNYIGRKYNTALTQYEGQTILLSATYGGCGHSGCIDLLVNNQVVDNAADSAGTYVAMHDLANGVNIGYDGTNYLDGTAHDIVMWDSDLTTANIEGIWNGHGPRDETATTLKGNLIGYWRGYNSTSTTAIDQSGNGLDGTGVNLDAADITYDYPRTFYDADTAASWDFDGSTERVDIPDDASLSFTDNQIHLSARINMDNATNFVIAEKDSEYLFWVNASDQLEARFIDASTGGYIGRLYSSSITGSIGDWTFVEATFDGSNVDLRIDGVVVDDTDANSGSFTAMENTANALTIAYDGTNYASGKISHLSIAGLNTTLCQGQELWNDGSPPDPSAITWSMVSHWKMDQSDDFLGTVNDIIGTNNGTAINGPVPDLNTYPTN